MKRATVLIDRVLVVLLGLAMLAAGALGSAWHFDVPFALDVWARFDRREFLALPAQGWWGVALAGTAVIAAILAIGLLIGNLTPRRTGTLLVSSGESLALRVELDAIARAVAADIARWPGVDSARGRAIDDRGTATLAIAVHASRHLDLDAFTRAAEARAGYLADALQGRGVALRVQLHV